MKVLKDRKHAKKNNSPYSKTVCKNTTVSILHNEFVEKYKKQTQTIPTLEKLLDYLDSKIEELQKRSSLSSSPAASGVPPGSTTIENLILPQQELHEYIQRREKIRKQLENMYNNKEMHNYYLQTGHLLVEYLADDYYDYSTGTNTTARDMSGAVSAAPVADAASSSASTAATAGAAAAGSTPVSLTQLFSFKSTKPPTNTKTSAANCNREHVVGRGDGRGGAAGAAGAPQRLHVSKQQVVSTFYKTVDEHYVGDLNTLKLNSDMCPDCGSCKRILNSVNSTMLCELCGLEEKILIDNETRSFKEPPREITFFAYKRINHFNEWLSEFQGRASTCITEDVIRQIQDEFRKEIYIREEDITALKVKEILRKLDMTTKYNEHCFYILFRLTGKAPPTLDDELVEQLKTMFRQLQAPWQKHCPHERNNFFSYPYVFYKFCELLERDEYLDACRDLLLKGEEKLMEHDFVWKKICEDLQWEFIRTI